MTIRVTITTPDNKQARVTHGADVHIVSPGVTREFCVHDSNPSIIILKQPADEGGVSTQAASGGGGHGVPPGN